MALPSTIHKLELTLSDTGRHYYRTHELVIARHPSETEERMMLRVLAFAWHADPDLAFGKGLSTDDEPDLWLKDLTGAIDLWIYVGQLDERWLRKASGRAGRVVVLAFGDRATDVWWEQNRATLQKLANLTVLRIAGDDAQALGALAKRSMALQCMIQDGEMLITGGEESLRIVPEKLTS